MTARYYSSIECYLIKDERFLSLANDTKLSWLWLLINSSRARCPGLIEGNCLSLAQFLFHPLKITEQERFQRAVDVSMSCISSLVTLGWVEHDLKVGLFFLPNAIKHNHPQNRNMLWRWVKNLRELPASPLIRRWITTTLDYLTVLYGREDERQKLMVSITKSLASNPIDPLECQVKPGYYSGYPSSFRDGLVTCLAKIENASAKVSSAPKQKSIVFESKEKLTLSERQRALYRLFETELFFVPGKGEQTVCANVSDPMGLCLKLGGEKYRDVDIEQLIQRLAMWSHEKKRKARKNLGLFLMSCFAKEQKECAARAIVDSEQSRKMNKMPSYDAGDIPPPPTEEEEEKRRQDMIRAGFASPGTFDGR